jgi:Gpi18-like mannosyltransferase
VARRETVSDTGIPMRAGLRHGLQTLLLSRILFFAVAFAAAWMLASSRGPLPLSFGEIWTQWDAEHLLRIARLGYTDPATHPHATVFFPLFPLLVRYVVSVGIPPVAAGLTISAVASLVAFAYLYRLVAEESHVEDGRRAVLYLALFPTSVFLIAPYSEALFLAGAIPAFYYARRARWIPAGLFAAVAMASRNTGMFLLVGLAFEFIRQRDMRPVAWRRVLAGLTVGSAPLVFYGAYLWRVKGEFFYFVTDYQQWGRTLTSPIEAIANSYSMTVLSEYPTNWMMAMRGEIIAVVFAVAAVAWCVARREWGYAAFGGTLLLVLISSPYYYSAPRSMLQFFPSVLFLTELTRQRPLLREPLLLILCSLATLGVVVFTQGYWFY